MKNLAKITLLFVFVISIYNCNSKKETIKITGKFDNDTINRIYIHDVTEKFSFKPEEDTTQIKITVKNGKFVYKTPNHKQPRALKLEIPLGEYGFYDILLFADGSNIDIKISKNEILIKGSKTNDEYEAYLKNLRATFKKEYDEIKPIQDSINTIGKLYFKNVLNMQKKREKLKETFSPNKKESIEKQIAELDAKKDEIAKMLKPLDEKIIAKRTPMMPKERDFKSNYIQKNPTFLSYYFLLDNLKRYGLLSNINANIDINNSKEFFNLLKKKFPNHPYNKVIEDLITKIEEDINKVRKASNKKKQ